MFHQWIQTIATILSFGITLAIFIIKTNKDREKFLAQMRVELESKINEVREEGKAGRERIYQRVDQKVEEVNERIETSKKDMRDNYVEVKICKILHETTDKNYKDLKDTFEKKIDELKQDIGKINSLIIDLSKK